MRLNTLALVLCLSSTGLGFGDSHEAVVRHTEASVLRIAGTMNRMTVYGPMAGPYVCSGFVIAPERVLMAEHCIGQSMTADGLDVQVLKVDEFYDLALLSVRTPKKPLDLSNKTLERGDAVTGMGYGWGFTRVIAIEGIVTLVDYQVPPEPDNKPMPPINFFQGGYVGGMSGGPIIDERGQVVGVVQMSGDGVGLGIGPLLIRAFLLGI